MDHLYLPYASNVELETIKEDDDNNAETVTDSQSTSSKISGGIMFGKNYIYIYIYLYLSTFIFKYEKSSFTGQIYFMKLTMLHASFY